MTDVLDDEDDEIDFHGAPCAPPGVPEVPVICEIIATDTPYPQQQLSFRCPFCDQVSYATTPHAGYGLWESNCGQGEYFLRDPLPGETVDLVSYRSRKTVPYDAIANPAGFNPNELAQVLTREKQARVEAYTEDYREWLADPIGPEPPGAAEAKAHMQWEAFQYRRQWGDEDAAYQSVYGEQDEESQAIARTRDYYINVRGFPADIINRAILPANATPLEKSRQEFASHLLDKLLEKDKLEKQAIAAREALGLSYQYEAEINLVPLPMDGADSDDHIAKRFTDTYGNTLRYVAAWGSWFYWDGMRWVKDETGKVNGLCRMHNREWACKLNGLSKGETKSLTSAGKVRSVLDLAKTDRMHATAPDAWDTDPWLLNTPGGIVSLRTGKMMDPDPAKYMTKITAVKPGGDCPLWLAFIDKATGGNRELARYLQRAAGYWLTGLTTEQALFFLWGTGGNGKGVFLNTITHIMADYAVTAAMDTFTAGNMVRHSTELAMLRGARLVTAQETDQGSTWNESRVKALTGGDPITARFMRQDNFTFIPAFSLAIGANHKPALNSVGEAIRRRMNLIPFTVTIREEEKDLDLQDKMKATEAGGILAWLISGCLAWQKEGLAPPAAVTDATKEYLAAEDSTSNWLADKCEIGKLKAHGSALLYQSYKQWMDAAGEKPLTQKAFIEEMGKRGYRIEHTRTGNEFQGIGLREESTSLFA